MNMLGTDKRANVGASRMFKRRRILFDLVEVKAADDRITWWVQV